MLTSSLFFGRHENPHFYQVSRALGAPLFCCCGLWGAYSCRGVFFSLCRFLFLFFSAFDAYDFCGSASGQNGPIPSAWCTLLRSHMIFGGPGEGGSDARIYSKSVVLFKKFDVFS